MVNSKNGAVFLILFTLQLLQRWGKVKGKALLEKQRKQLEEIMISALSVW
ncbi:hypothetical protein [Desulfosarcina sp.]|nr:hypothetical protein [Desulfosarcina sp.]MDX2451191.1 hypothetical protein [Desulfosarcina sp.]